MDLSSGIVESILAGGWSQGEIYHVTALHRLMIAGKMAPFCREFGISRVTGYKIYNRYRECGLGGLNDPGQSVNYVSGIHLLHRAL